MLLFKCTLVTLYSELLTFNTSQIREAEKFEKIESEPIIAPEKIEETEMAAQDFKRVAKQPEPEIDDDWDFDR